MTKINENVPVICYPAGAYGSFISWALLYFSGRTMSLPFNKNGNSHRLNYNKISTVSVSNGTINWAVTDSSTEILKCHPMAVDGLDSSAKDTIETLLSVVNKIVFLYGDDNSTLLVLNNKFDKVWDEGWITAHSKIHDFGTPWGKDTKNMDNWEIRESLSYYIEGQHAGELQNDFVRVAIESGAYANNVLFVPVRSLFDDFKTTILQIASHVGYSFVLDDFDDIYNIWESLQIHKHKDVLISNIISAITTSQPYTWDTSDLSLVDEAYIQLVLRRDYDKQLRCFNLNEFPTSADAMRELIISRGN